MSDAAERIRDFFTRLLPAALARNEAALRAGRGHVGFIIPGAGEWSVQLGPSSSAEAAVEAGPALEADLVLMFRPDTFEAFLGGEMPTVGQGFVVDGDTSLLEPLGRVLQPPARGGLGARLAAF